ncbi:hypothetical protein VPH35_001871 [Triticum aestivum]|uniref:sulfated surface glycoprotein 185-like n=1 Tax=Triticum aestivum TaxID=4565 RepID=UPI001D0266E3|nr:sulfated surface glycoprotein 185-like [Triticum aestivum]XP_044445056.1 sulfated surface glycoprotein 185-like [Triticum aestivum]
MTTSPIQRPDRRLLSIPTRRRRQWIRCVAACPRSPRAAAGPGNLSRASITAAAHPPHARPTTGAAPRAPPRIQLPPPTCTPRTAPQIPPPPDCLVPPANSVGLLPSSAALLHMTRRPPAPAPLIPEATAQEHCAIGNVCSTTHHAPQLWPLHLLAWHPSRVNFSGASDRPSRRLILESVNHCFRINSTPSSDRDRGASTMASQKMEIVQACVSEDSANFM